MINRKSLYGICLALLCCTYAVTAARAESGDTRIKLRFSIKATMAENPGVPGVIPGSSGPARHNYAIVLKPDGSISENYEGSGRFVLVKKDESALGLDGSSLRYKVIDQNTIQRTAENDAQIQTFTIKVDGESCRMDYRAELKPGKKVFVAFSQSRGKMMNYRSFELMESACTIE